MYVCNVLILLFRSFASCISMKKHLITKGLAFAACLLFWCFSSDGQTVPRKSIDTDICALRNDVINDFDYSYDDWLQYAPAGVMLGLKAFGYEGRSPWDRMLVSDAISIATTVIVVNGIKYSVARMRPDQSARNSFPSGHTATAFMSATLLSKEYRWRSPWYSIGGYTAAALTGVSRIMNNRHWLSDVIAGAVIGIGSVQLGYYLTDLIFKDRDVYKRYCESAFAYAPTTKHYVAELLFARRFFVESSDDSFRGSFAGLSVDIPMVPGAGLTLRTSANTLLYQNIAASLEPYAMVSYYNALAGGYYNLPFAKRIELQGKAMAGYVWQDGASTITGIREVSGLDLCAGLSLGVMLDKNFKLKMFCEFESIQCNAMFPWLNAVNLGFSSSWIW